MSDFIYNKPIGSDMDVQEKLKLFPEVHIYKSGSRLYNQPKGKQVNIKRAGTQNTKEIRKLELFFFFIILFLLCILAIELVFHFVISPKMMINKVIVRNENSIDLTNGEVLRLAELEGDLFFFSINTDEIKERLLTYPLIKEAKVEKKFPDSLFIELTGRNPLAMSIVDTNDGGVPVVFDENGVVFQIGASVAEMNNLVISGIVFKNIQLGMKLPEEIFGLLKCLQELRNEALYLFNLISEVKVIKRNGSLYEAVVFISGYEMPVRIGMSLDKQELTYILMVLDVVTRDELKDGIQELDLRNGEVVYKVKEVDSGE